MFALIVYDKVLLFDLVKCYGLYDLASANLEGYELLPDFKKIITYYHENHFHVDEVFSVEQYSKFLYRICLKYLKDC